MAGPMKPLYFDHNATTPLDPKVKAAMDPYLGEDFGNASSSSHAYGWKAQMGVEKARAQVAGLLSCQPKEVIFTSGATESNNLAIIGVLLNLMKNHGLDSDVPHFITTQIEHKAVLEVFDRLKLFGATTTVLPVDSQGHFSMKDLEAAITKNTKLISIMGANNEIGTINPIEEVAQLCEGKNILFHTDCAQLVGRQKISFKDHNFYALSLSGHKVYGPKGIGALIVRMEDQKKLCPLVVGGEQEKGLRPGTLNVPGIAGLGEACKIMMETMDDEILKLKAFQKRLFDLAKKHSSQLQVNGDMEQRLCNNVSLSFKSITPDQMALHLGGIAFSSGSACSSADAKPSYVLKAMGHNDMLARQTLRLGMGRFTRTEDVDFVIERLNRLLERSAPSASLT